MAAFGLAVALSAPSAAAETTSSGANSKAAATSSTVATRDVHRAKGCGFQQRDESGDLGVAIEATDYLVLDQYDDWAADDFVCKRKVHRVRKIVIIGQYNDTTEVGTSIDLRVLRHDPAGQVDEPSDDKVVCALLEQSFEQFSRLGTVLVQPRGIPCHLKAGQTYWLDVQMRMDGLTGAFLGWEMTSIGTGSPGDWKNPPDGLQTGCTTYSAGDAGGDRSARDCTAPWLGGDQFMFSIR
jgi:hypothetical protein